MKCPRCASDLAEIEINGVKVDRCGKCGGIWFDKNELEAVRDQRDQNLSWLDFDLWGDENQLKAGGTSMNCPRDGKPLFKIQYASANVTADVCLECRGVWLDKEELEKIISALKEKVNAETLPEYLRDLEKELGDMIAEPAHLRKDLHHVAIIMKLIEYRLAAQYPKITEITSSLPD